MPGLEIKSVIALVTGANRGIGRAIVDTLLREGAKRIYAGARKPDSLKELVALAPDRIVPVKLDVTSDADIAAAAKQAGDVNVLINNAGALQMTPDLDSIDIQAARNEMNVNYFGVLAMTKAFAPVLARNGGGMVVNIASVVSFVTYPALATYCPTKHAVHSLSQSLRVMLAGQGTSVMTVHPGPIDTDMASELEMEKFSPHDVAERIVKAIAAGEELITTDPFAESVFAEWRKDPLKAQRDAVAEPAKV